ncbi:MAG: hypothetical protein FWG91_00195 [Lachnospiraceae bacterium]|nr:hypothetical protein [Lachnospiraceae bacterium]
MADIIIDDAGFIYLRLYILPHSKPLATHLPYKVDTGANRTTISKAILNNLGYDDDWIRQGGLLKGRERPTTATGEIIMDCYKVVLPEIRLGKWTGTNWSFLVRLNDDKKKQFRLLFGTDSMCFFKWSFDYESGICTYEGIEGKKLTNYSNKVQCLHSLDELNN